MKSIMHDKDSQTCYLCAKLDRDFSEKTILEEHHCIYGRGLRRLSEKWGLKVYLCPEHHRVGKKSAHQDPGGIGLMLRQEAQQAFCRKWPDKSFYGIFGRNYIYWEQTEPSEEWGFRILEDEDETN